MALTRGLDLRLSQEVGEVRYVTAKTRLVAGAAAAGLLTAAFAMAEPIEAPAGADATAQQDRPGRKESFYPVVASPDGRTLLRADGEPFLYLADTVWLAPSRLTQADIRQLVDTRADQGFTTLQVSLLPFPHLPGLENAYGSPAVVGTDLARPVEIGKRTSNAASPDYDYWDHVDYLFARAAERDMQLTVVPSWYGYQGEDWRGHVDTESARAYGEFLGRRLGGHRNLMWLLGGDNNPLGDVRKVPRGAGTGDVAEATRAMAQAIAATEAVPHLMSYHTARGVSSLTYFADDGWHGFASAYSDEYTWRRVADSRDRGVPVVMTEAFYDGRERPPRLDRQELRAQAWWSVLGGAGYAYGHEDVWDLDPGQGPGSSGGASSWQQALRAPSVRDVTLLAETVQGLLPVRPSSDVVLAARGWDETRAVGALSADGRTALAYVPERRWIKVALGVVSTGEVALSWLDPASGEVADAGVRPSSGTLEVRPPSRFDDAVLIMRGR